MEQRYRSPTFKPTETSLLVNLVGNYKNIIMSKCLNSATNVAKEKAWMKITKQFNKENVGNDSRATESLKSKWENLKRQCSKIYVDELSNMDINSVLYNVHTIIDSCKDLSSLDALQQISDDSDDETQMDIDRNDSISCRKSNSEEKLSRLKKMKVRSSNFTTLECQLLINLVKREKDNVFSNEPYKKCRAWRKIAESFNKRFPERKRTSRVLCTKYQNMKSVVRKLSNPLSIPKLNVKTIKQEPEIHYTGDFFNKTDDGNNDLSGFAEILDESNNVKVNEASDPLRTVLTALEHCNSDSGMGCNSEAFNVSEDRDVLAMQKQLLNHQLENAKLERKRLQDAMNAEVEERRVKSQINTIRLRTARLEMAVAESKLPSNHPALIYTESEECITTFH